MYLYIIYTYSFDTYAIRTVKSFIYLETLNLQVMNGENFWAFLVKLKNNVVPKTTPKKSTLLYRESFPSRALM